jgi:predicted RNA-binding protein YlxR (DUF448 family)
VACRTSRQKREFVRIVRTPAGEVVMDPTGRLAGRGAYLCADGSCWHVALAKGALQRALATPLPAELRATLENGAVRRAGAGATIDQTAGTGSLQEGELLGQE